MRSGEPEATRIKALMVAVRAGTATTAAHVLADKATSGESLSATTRLLETLDSTTYDPPKTLTTDATITLLDDTTIRNITPEEIKRLLETSE